MTNTLFTHSPANESLLSEIRTKLPSFIDGKRLEHTFFVEKEAISIAEIVFMVYNISDVYLRDVSAAALLHDITKQMPMEKHLEMCREYGIDAGEHPSGAILQGKTAAHLAKSIFSISDAVFSAVYCHTTGRENMNILDKIIFLADYIEPSRTHKHCIQTRKYFYETLQLKGKNSILSVLDNAVIMSIDGTISHLIESKKSIDIQTVLARNYIINRMMPDLQGKERY